MTVEELRKLIIEKAWQDEQFKARLLENPKKAVEEEFSFSVPDEFEVTVVEETNQHYYLVIPPNPADTETAITSKAAPWD